MDAIRPAVAYTFSYGAYPIDKVVASVKQLLQLSAANDVPVILHLDGVNYLTEYPQLWNFWDEDAPGYAPENRANVERYGWGEDNAVKIGWRTPGLAR